MTPTHEVLVSRNLLSSQHIVDTGYLDAGILVETAQRFTVDLIGPVQRGLRRQARDEAGFSAKAFSIEWDKSWVTCPQGAHSTGWTPSIDICSTDIIKVKFSQQDCRPCPYHVACAGPKTMRSSMTLRSEHEYEALTQARRRQQTPAFKALYAQRAGIETTMSLAVRSYGARRTRYVGLAKTRLRHATTTAAAINVVRILRWIVVTLIATTRDSHFVHLLAPAVA